MGGAKLTMFAFDNTWEVLGLLGGIVALRVAIPRAPVLRRQRAAVLEFVDSGLVAVLLVFCILRPFVVQAFYIPSGSMLPTLQINDRILVSKFLYFFREPQFADVVVFRAPPLASVEKKDFIKRVVGLPGDSIAVRQEGVYRNGRRLTESYVMDSYYTYVFPQSGGEYVVPEGALLVLGDNRNSSRDSHVWGLLPRENVLGKAFFIFWPPQRISLVSH